MPNWNAPDLRGQVAVVTGASRGVGKGIALALGDTGATVYVTGRTEHDGDSRQPGSIGSTAEQVSEPGIVRTELVMDHQDTLPFDLSRSESPELTGRAVAHLAADPEVMSLSGRVCVVAELTQTYGFTDVDGSQPRSLRRPHSKEQNA